MSAQSEFKRTARPEFAVVSGVSTGALITPFAFLGTAYDATLRDVFTGDRRESSRYTELSERAFRVRPFWECPTSRTCCPVR